MELKRQKQVEIEKQRRSLILNQEQTSQTSLNLEASYNELKLESAIGLFQNPLKLKCLHQSSLESMSKKEGFAVKSLQFKDNQYVKNKIDLHDQVVTGLHILSNEYFQQKDLQDLVEMDLQKQPDSMTQIKSP